MDTRSATFEKYLQEMELSAATVYSYKHAADKFEKFREGREITKELLIEYKVFLIEQRYAVNSVNLYIIGLNQYIRFCEKSNYVLKTLSLHKKQSIENVISEADYRNLMDVASSSGRKKYYLIMQTLAVTGVRVSELRYITIEGIEDGYAQVSSKGKVKEIYFPEKLVASLQEYCREEKIFAGAVFRGSKNSAISREAVWKMLKRLSASM